MNSSNGRQTVSRVLSALMISTAIGFYMNWDEARQGAMGKTAYLASQSARYDTFLVQPPVGVIIAAIIMLCFFIGVYELLAFVIYKVIARREQE